MREDFVMTNFITRSLCLLLVSITCSSLLFGATMKEKMQEVIGDTTPQIKQTTAAVRGATTDSTIAQALSTLNTFLQAYTQPNPYINPTNNKNISSFPNVEDSFITMLNVFDKLIQAAQANATIGTQGNSAAADLKITFDGDFIRLFTPTPSDYR